MPTLRLCQYEQLKHAIYSDVYVQCSISRFVYFDIFFCLEVLLSSVRDVDLTQHSKYGSLLLSSSQLQAVETKIMKGTLHQSTQQN